MWCLTWALRIDVLSVVSDEIIRRMERFNYECGSYKLFGLLSVPLAAQEGFRTVMGLRCSQLRASPRIED